MSELVCVSRLRRMADSRPPFQPSSCHAESLWRLALTCGQPGEEKLGTYDSGGSTVVTVPLTESRFSQREVQSSRLCPATTSAASGMSRRPLVSRRLHAHAASQSSNESLPEMNKATVNLPPHAASVLRVTIIAGRPVHNTKFSAHRSDLHISSHGATTRRHSCRQQPEWSLGSDLPGRQ